MTVKCIPRVLSSLQVHELVVAQAAHPRLARLVMVKLLQLLIIGVLDQKAAALLIGAHAD